MTNNYAVKLNHIYFFQNITLSFSQKLLEILEISLQHLIDLIKIYNCHYEYLF